MVLDPRRSLAQLPQLPPGQAHRHAQQSLPRFT
ncbi:hypothetical protein CNYM01_07487 [Colletotrichum nymphaeae SA-01]|uniref:Uncharacterized protein n=1 Tax=Colletotrichum nymphaeae SA-01 TaxID=1460502 RepID=A0A135T930_9PEZI|nr:hypothetical protein CNYM01_07487 [Colletotrichum nymphaeae SA-01]